MAKKESTFMNMLVTLFVVTLVCSTSLAFIYEATKAPIAKAEAARKLEAINHVVSGFNNNPADDMFKVPSPYPGDSLECYPAKKDGHLVGMAIRTLTKKGYGGTFWLMVGFDATGKISDIDVLENKETPGLGAKMVQPEFKDQFKGIDPAHFNLKVKKDGGDVDAITAATITSRAFCDAVKNAVNAYDKQTKK